MTRWILANGVGMALGFLAFVNIVFFVAFGLQFELYWTEPQDDLENAEELLRRALVLGLPLAGAIFTTFQRWLLLWIAGLPLGAVVFMLAYTLIDMVYSISWAGEVGLIGFATGSSAAAVSGRAFLRAISVEASAATAIGSGPIDGTGAR